MQASFHRLASPDTPADAVLVSVFSMNGVTVGTVHRNLYVVNGSVSPPECDGPMPMPQALDHAREILTACKGLGLERIVVRMGQDQFWLPEWGQLVWADR